MRIDFHLLTDSAAADIVGDHFSHTVPIVVTVYGGKGPIDAGMSILGKVVMDID